MTDTNKKEVRLTDKEVFTRLIEVVKNSGAKDCGALIERLEHKIELIENKANNRSEKPTENQVKNNEYKKMILDTLAANDEPMTISDIKAANVEFESFTPQKISALLQGLKEHVDKQEIKRKAYFSLK